MKIWKFPLDITDLQFIEMPVGAKILTAQFQGNVLNVWAECEPDNLIEEVPIRIIGTGNPVFGDMTRWRYLTTVQQYGGELVWHVYV